MIQPEQIHSSASAAASKVALPGDISMEITLTQATITGTQEVADFMHIRMTIESDEPGGMRFGILLRNSPELSQDTFEVWLTGWLHGVVALTGALDVAVAAEEAQHDAPRLH